MTLSEKDKLYKEANAILDDIDELLKKVSKRCRVKSKHITRDAINEQWISRITE